MKISCAFAAATGVALVFGSCVEPLTAQTTTRVSVDSDGVAGSQSSATYGLAMSADGRFVAFDSRADNLVSGDTNGSSDVFVHDRETGETLRVSVSSDGVEGNDVSATPALSRDGRFVAFASNATTLVPEDENDAWDVFVVDRESGDVVRVSVDSAGTEADGRSASFPPALSGDGRFVVFDSEASNLVEDDTNRVDDVFLHDRQTGTTTRLSIGDDGQEANGRSIRPAISSDGRWVAFESIASNLVPGDTNDAWDVFVVDRATSAIDRVSISTTRVQAESDCGGAALSADGRFVAFTSRAASLSPEAANPFLTVFVHDRETGETTRTSENSSGATANGASARPAISADGRFVAFDTRATNLVLGDTNGFRDVLVCDRDDGDLERASVAADGEQGDGGSFMSAISADARFVAFRSAAENLVSDDSNRRADVFVRDRETCGTGTVNLALGPAVPLLRANGATGSVRVAIGRAVTITLDASPAGPPIADYVLWVWTSLPARQTPLMLSGYDLGCTVNPVSLAAPVSPQPVLCLHSAEMSASVCSGVHAFPSPESAPWTIERKGGFTHPVDFTLQGVVQDNGSVVADSALSITNAVTLRVR
ncbi:MAG: PD40 domain-containing protein [Planctomycetes bacterium]|nr:PD40 domain-containing protein [Planctomycetota bacterium]MBI3844827.1 PD40 domain-containing protein [Planctomycetota bacterium]